MSREVDSIGFDLATEALTRKVFTGEDFEYLLCAFDLKDRFYIWDWFATNYQDFTRHIHSTAKDTFVDGCLLAWETFRVRTTFMTLNKSPLPLILHVVVSTLPVRPIRKE